MYYSWKNDLPGWVYTVGAKYQTVLSDDIDGLVSTAILNYISGWEIEYFYDFETLWVTEDFINKKYKSATRVWADISLIGKEEKCFDNHINRGYVGDKKNRNMVNPNIIGDVANNNYFDKYAGSTALMLWSIYDLRLPESDLGKQILLCIDSSFKGFYETNKRFCESHGTFMDCFGFLELLKFELIHTKKDFENTRAKYNLSDKIRMVDGYLKTTLPIDLISKELGIPIVLPEKKFVPLEHYEKHKENRCGIESIRELPQATQTLAFTGKDKVVFSTLKKKEGRKNGRVLARNDNVA